MSLCIPRGVDGRVFVNFKTLNNCKKCSLKEYFFGRTAIAAVSPIFEEWLRAHIPSDADLPWTQSFREVIISNSALRYALV